MPARLNLNRASLDSRDSPPKWLVPAVTLFLILAAVSWYFVSYVPRQENYFAHRNIRLLALTADRLKATIEGVERATKMAAKSVGTRLGKDEDDEARLLWLRKAFKLIPMLTFPDISVGVTE